MRIFATLLRRELRHFFFPSRATSSSRRSRCCWIEFCRPDCRRRSAPFTAPVTEMFYSTFYFWLILLLATPVITMRLFALEKASGTFETLMTTPVGDLQVVVAKSRRQLFFT